MAEEADIIRWILPGIPTHEIFTRREAALTGFPCLFEKTEELQAAPENNAAAGEYILPTSNSEYLTEETLISKGLTKEQLGLARNEIFARHGRMFDTAEIQQYFDSRSWYVPKYAPAEFDAMGDGIFNEYEKYNMESIKALEDKLG